MSWVWVEHRWMAVLYLISVKKEGESIFQNPTKSQLKANEKPTQSQRKANSKSAIWQTTYQGLKLKSDVGEIKLTTVEHVQHQMSISE